MQQRVEGMVFDSASGKWVGNEDAVRSFPGSASPRRPALIKTTQGSASKPQERSGMRWDPRRMMWDGNEADTARFDKHKPALISGQGVMTPQAIAKLIPGHNMRYDAERQTWVGNDEDADVFKGEGKKIERKTTLVCFCFLVSIPSQSHPSLSPSRCANGCRRYDPENQDRIYPFG